MVTETPTPSADLEAQRRYVESKKGGFNYGLTVEDAFVRGIRDIGYKNTGTALDEHIDNAQQAGAQDVHVAFGFEGKSDKKPTAIALIDDGHGMIPDMIRLAVIWGGTHRENDRTGYGRYGYGLPSSSVSQGKRFTVFSRVDGGDLYAVTLDLDAIAAGSYSNDQGQIIVPEPKVMRLPGWVLDYIEENFPGGIESVRTVILLEKLDRLTWSTSSPLERNLLEHFGVHYRNALREMNIVVQGKRVEAVDPLFITPGAKFYDLDEDRAEALDPLLIEVKDPETRKVIGSMNIRFSYMPPSFGREDKTKERGRMNARFPIMKDHNGIIFLRAGRQIDVARTGCPWTTFVNYDRNWGVEVDFTPSLDEEFRMTTSKQQVVASERIWEILRENGVNRAIEEMRKRFKEENARLKAEGEQDEEAKRASEQAMEDAMSFVPKKPMDVNQEKKAEETLDFEARRRAKDSQVPVEDVKKQLEAEAKQKAYKVENRSLRGAPFFSVEQRGGQKVLVLNTAHRFYADVYAGPESTPRLRAALEVVLFVIGDCELDATEQRQLWYGVERGEWSKRLEVTLALLDKIDPTTTDLPDVEGEGDDVESAQTA